jgi:hypothetical protein
MNNRNVKKVSKSSNRTKQSPPAPTGKRRKRNRQKKTAVRMAQGRPGFNLSPCSRKYLRALTDPFSFVTGACVPDERNQPSLKVSSLWRGTFQAGNTSGFGCIIVAPTTYANDVVFAVDTDSVYNAGVTPPFTGVVVGANNQLDAQLPFTFSQFYIGSGQNALEARLVGCGVRVRYIGSQLNLSGRYIIAQAPYSLTVEGLSVSQLLSSQSCRSVIINSSRKWEGIFWQPMGTEDYEYSRYAVGNLNENNTTAAASRSLASLVIAVDGATQTAGSPSTYEVEIVRYFEFTRRTGILGLTASHSDVPGMSAVRDATHASDRAPTPSSSTYSYYMNWISKMAGQGISAETAGKSTVSLRREVMRSDCVSFREVIDPKLSRDTRDKFRTNTCTMSQLKSGRAQ